MRRPRFQKERSNVLLRAKEIRGNVHLLQHTLTSREGSLTPEFANGPRLDSPHQLCRVEDWAALRLKQSQRFTKCLGQLESHSFVIGTFAFCWTELKRRGAYQATLRHGNRRPEFSKRTDWFSQNDSSRFDPRLRIRGSELRSPRSPPDAERRSHSEL